MSSGHAVSWQENNRYANFQLQEHSHNRNASKLWNLKQNLPNIQGSSG
jgi:hypothetical protein